MKNILVFSYDGFHKKSEDLLWLSKIKNLNIKIILLNPWKNIKKKNNFKGFESIQSKSVVKISALSKKLSYESRICNHSDFDQIRKIVKRKKINLAIIFGARILKKKIIDLFKYGVINYHPGSLPETSGLDSFYWMIEKKIFPKVTCHLIDGRVDAGLKIMEEKINLLKEDELPNVEKKLYLAQLEMHSKLCNIIQNINNLKKKKIKNYSKNKPMTVKQKKIALKKFKIWKKKNYEKLL